jgi:hypothetical protein
MLEGGDSVLELLHHIKSVPSVKDERDVGRVDRRSREVRHCFKKEEEGCVER